MRWSSCRPTARASGKASTRRPFSSPTSARTPTSCACSDVSRVKCPSVDEIEELERSLRRRFRVDEAAVDVGDVRIVLLHPANPEDLIDEQEFERDERLPYWADLWPSAKLLG